MQTTFLPLIRFILLMVLSLSTAHAQFFTDKTPVLLPEDEAFAVSTYIDGQQLHVNWSIADDYYMYRDQFRVETTHPDIVIGKPIYPQGDIEDDPEFGQVEVYFYNTQYTVPIEVNFTGDAQEVEFVLRGQGCNKPVGVCYPPQTRTLIQTVAASSDASVNNDSPTPTSLDQQLTGTDQPSPATEKSFWGYILAAFGAGILLSFTPCVLPMIPILAGVIVRQHNPSKRHSDKSRSDKRRYGKSLYDKWRSGWLAMCYVLGTIVTYAIAGWMAGLAGIQLQAYFQNLWVIGFICLLLLVLAASLFGWFKVELPSSVQTKLSTAFGSNNSASVSSFLLGLMSALIVGACVSPILIVTLGAAISQGDPVLGASIMSAMALGMGLLLILFGFGAGWILPKTGAWMNHIQVLFGFMVIGTAIFLASTLNGFPVLYSWGGLLLITGFYLWSIGQDVAQETTSSLLSSLFRALATGALLWGAMCVIGGSTGGSDVLRPLNSLSVSSTTHNSAQLIFNKVTTRDAALELLAQAKQQGAPAMVDFYADWCLDCKRMHRTTFVDPTVIAALQEWVIIEIDVTNTNADSQASKDYFNVFGPPATLFFNPDGSEQQLSRQYGYLSSEKFLALLDTVLL